jgi:hypothetical protein
MHAMAVSKAVVDGGVGEPGVGTFGGLPRALGHQQHAGAVEGAEGCKRGEEVFDFLQVGLLGHDKLELIFPRAAKQRCEGREVEPASLVALGPGAIGVASIVPRRAVAKLGGDAHELHEGRCVRALAQAAERHGARGFDRDVHAQLPQASEQRGQVREDQRLATRDDAVTHATASGEVLLDGRDEIVDGLHGAFGVPACVGRVAPGAAQVAATEAHEKTRDARQQPLTLHAQKLFTQRKSHGPDSIGHASIIR